MKHVILLYVVMAFGALSYCLSLLVSKDAPVFLILTGGFTGLVILTAVSWLVWNSENEPKQIVVQSASGARSVALTGEDAQCAGVGADDIKKQGM